MSVFEEPIKKIDRVVHILSWAAIFLAGATILYQALVQTAYVVARDFFGQEWRFFEEWSEYLLVFIAYFGLAYTFRAGGHIRMDMVVDHLPPRVKKGVDVIVSLLAVLIVGVMAYWSIQRIDYTWTNNVRSVWPSRMPMWIPYLSLPIGLILLDIEVLLHIAKTVRLAVGGVSEGEKTMTSEVKL